MSVKLKEILCKFFILLFYDMFKSKKNFFLFSLFLFSYLDVVLIVYSVAVPFLLRMFLSKRIIAIFKTKTQKRRSKINAKSKAKRYEKAKHESSKDKKFFFPFLSLLLLQSAWSFAQNLYSL